MTGFETLKRSAYKTKKSSKNNVEATTVPTEPQQLLIIDKSQPNDKWKRVEIRRYFGFVILYTNFLVRSDKMKSMKDPLKGSFYKKKSYNSSFSSHFMLFINWFQISNANDILLIPCLTDSIDQCIRYFEWMKKRIRRWRWRWWWLEKAWF